jgi:hypothetical protein
MIFNTLNLDGHTCIKKLKFLYMWAIGTKMENSKEFKSEFESNLN